MLFTTIIRGLFLLLNFIAGLIFAKLILPENFGIISLLVLNTAMISLITGLGTDSIMMYSYNSGKWNANQSFSFSVNSFTLQLFLFILLELGSFYFKGSSLLLGMTNEYLAYEFFYFIGIILIEKYTFLFYTFKQSRKANLVLLTSSIFYILLLATIPLFFEMDIFAAVVISAFYVLFQGLVLLIFFHLNNKDLKYSPFNSSHIYQALKLSFIIMGTNFIQMLAYRIDFWVIQKYHSNYEIGIYAQATKFANLMWVIPNIFVFLLMSRFTKINKCEFEFYWRVLFLFNLLVFIVTIFFTYCIYHFYLPQGFQNGESAFFLMLPGYFFWSVVIYLSAYYSAKGQFKINLYGSTFCLFIIFLLDIFLIPSLGIQGAAISNSIAYTCVFIYYGILLKRQNILNLNHAFRFAKNDITRLKSHFLSNE